MALLLLLMLVASPGCWDYREINDLAIVSALGIDVTGDARTVRASVLIALPGGGGGGGGGGGAGGMSSGPPALMEMAEGVSLGEAFNRLNSFTGRRPIFSHTRVLVFSEKAARQGLERLLDVLTRWYEFRRTMVVFIARPDAAQCLDIESPLSKDPTNFLLGLARSPVLAGANAPTMQDLLDGLQSSRREALIPLIEPVPTPHVHAGGPGGGGGGGGGGSSAGGREGGGQEQPRREPAVRVAGLAVMRRDRMIAVLNPAETLDWLILTGRMKRAFAVLPDPRRPGRHITVQFSGVQRRIKARRGNPPSVHIELTLPAEIAEIESGLDYATAAGRDRLETSCEQAIQRDLEKLVRRAQHEFRTDIFDFGEFFIGKFLYWDEWLKYGWLRRQFPRADIRLHVNVSIIRPGATLRPIRPMLQDSGGSTEVAAGEAARTRSQR
ncbi:MAG: Ger(x)C family spore germination protein [Chitinophagales bacterium]